MKIININIGKRSCMFHLLRYEGLKIIWVYVERSKERGKNQRIKGSLPHQPFNAFFADGCHSLVACVRHPLLPLFMLMLLSFSLHPGAL
jgi:hypothetical protein